MLNIENKFLSQQINDLIDTVMSMASVNSARTMTQNEVRLAMLQIQKYEGSEVLQSQSEIFIDVKRLYKMILDDETSIKKRLKATKFFRRLYELLLNLLGVSIGSIGSTCH